MNSPNLSRREILGAAAVGAIAFSFRKEAVAAHPHALVADPGVVAISSANGLKALEKAYAMAMAGADPLDAAVAGVNLVEDDPNDITVGLGGLPNEEGVVELDASVMHGPKHLAGAVASIRGIRNPSKVAKLILDRTNHVLLVGEGALRFAKAHGFQEENLLTEKSRKIWLHWKETHSKEDDWLPPPDAELDKEVREYFGHHGTIHVGLRTKAGDFAGVTSTSGLSFKIPGRVGDSPIIGCGNYVDNEVGSCGSTGRGESVILSTGSAAVVEAMRRGASPKDACLEILQRIARQTRRKHHLDAQGRPHFNVNFYAIHKSGAYAGAALWSGSRFAVADAKGARLEESSYLFERK